MNLTLRHQAQLIGIVGSAIALLGCTHHLNSDAVASEISETFTIRTGLRLNSVTCPDNEPVKQDAIFKCEGMLEQGQLFALTVTQVDTQENISWDAKAALQTLKGIIDNERLAAQISAGIKSQTNIDVITDCGALFRIARTGEMFTCSTIDQQNTQTEVMVKVQDDEGNVSWEL